MTFQSTLLMRGATRGACGHSTTMCYFNPRSSCEERRHGRRQQSNLEYFNPRSSCEERQAGRECGQLLEHISIHAPHARSDKMRKKIYHRRSHNFNPRSSCEERQFMLFRNFWTAISIHAPHARSDQQWGGPFADGRGISIHAPHARSDICSYHQCTYVTDFNPRSSCEERQTVQITKCERLNFNPRSSCEERHEVHIG